MLVEGLDELDNKILEAIRDNARLTYSQIEEIVGVSRITVQKRMKAMEDKGIIKGYVTVIDRRNTAEGIRFALDIEVDPEYYYEVVETLSKNYCNREIYSTTGECAIHVCGYAPSVKIIEEYSHNLYYRNRGIRKCRMNIMTSTLQDIDGGLMYERAKLPENKGDIQ